MNNKYKSCVVQTRLNQDYCNMLDIKASQHNLSRAVYVREVLIKHLEEGSENLIYKALENTQTTCNTLNTKMEFLTQLFNFWLGNYFLSHPSVDSSNAKALGDEAENRRKKFVNSFLQERFNSNGNFYDKCFADSVENEEEQ